MPVLLALAAAQNGRAAQACLAEMYAQGLGIERDDSEALRLAEGVRRQCRLH